MDQRGIVEIGASTAACGAAAAGTFQILAGRIDWLLVVGIAMIAAIAAAANYRARTTAS